MTQIKIKITQEDCRYCPFHAYPPTEVGMAFHSCCHPILKRRKKHPSLCHEPNPNGRYMLGGEAVRPYDKDKCPLFDHPVLICGGVKSQPREA